MSRFQLKGPAPAAIPTGEHSGSDAFVHGADQVATQPVATGGTKNFSLRIEPPLQAKIDRVFRHSTYKSKQQMVVDLLTKALDSVPLHDG